MSTTFKQEGPPEGGYRPVYFQRTKAAKFFSTPVLLAIHTLPTIYWYWAYHYDKKMIARREIEERSTLIALQPMIEAENDREYLRQVRKNRDEERELMKNVPGWEVGTLYGEPVYKTIDPDTLINQSVTEYYAHTRLKYMGEFIWFRHWQ